MALPQDSGLFQPGRAGVLDEEMPVGAGGRDSAVRGPAPAPPHLLAQDTAAQRMAASHLTCVPTPHPQALTQLIPRLHPRGLLTSPLPQPKCPFISPQQGLPRPATQAGGPVIPPTRLSPRSTHYGPVVSCLFPLLLNGGLCDHVTTISPRPAELLPCTDVRWLLGWEGGKEGGNSTLGLGLRPSCCRAGGGHWTISERQELVE